MSKLVRSSPYHLILLNIMIASLFQSLTAGFTTGIFALVDTEVIYIRKSLFPVV